MISKKIGVVTEILDSDENIDTVKVNIEGNVSRAYNYKKITGKVLIGNKVLLNTTAVELSLGTGGYHFIISNLDNLESDFTEGGHIMKLRYTPIQVKVETEEEQDSKNHNIFNEFESLENMPVAVGTLHSMLAPFSATFKANTKDKKLVYVMTDGAALPIALSKTVKDLKEKGLIDKTITIGNAFGGDYECINIYTALITAKEIIKADAVFISMGPGIAGTGTKYGFTGVEQANILDATSILKGKAYAIMRMSFADKRERHYGISHHSITILKELTNKKVEIILNNSFIKDEKLKTIENQLLKSGLDKKHDISFVEYNDTKKDLEKYNLKVRSMGRNFEADSEFFISPSTVAFEISKKIKDKTN